MTEFNGFYRFRHMNNNNPDQLDLFDSANYKLTGVVPKEITDKWQMEFYSAKIDSQLNKPKKSKPVHMDLPSYIDNRDLEPYVGITLPADIVDVRICNRMGTRIVEVVYSVATEDGRELIAQDTVGLPQVPDGYTVAKMRAYLQMFPTRKQMVIRDERAMRSINDFYASLWSRFWQLRDGSRHQLRRAYVTPCVSSKGNIYLQVRTQP